MEATFFILSCHVLSLVEHELWVVSSRQDRRSAFPPFLVERTPLFPSMYSKRLRALGSSPSQTPQVLDAVPAKSGSVWFVLFPPPPELKTMYTILFGDFFSFGETDKMNDCPGPQLRSSREPSSRSSECHVGHVCEIQRKRFEVRSLGTLHMYIHAHPDARLSAACLPQY